MAEKFIVLPQELHFTEPLPMDSGAMLKDVVLRYETAGTLNERRTNAVLITHALTGDAHVCGYHSETDTKPGWWDNLIGPGKYLDTDKYFVICSNFICGCSGSTGPRSINPETGKLYNLDFPVTTIRDMVRAQERLITHLGIKKLLAVVGGSMGGMQVLQWAVDFPDRLQAAAPIATACQFSPQNIAFDWVAREAIKADPNWNNGAYSDDNPPDKGLAAARMLAHITYLSEETMGRKFGRHLQNKSTLDYAFDHDFQVESYLEHQGKRFVERFDADSYCYITRATDYFDLTADTDGDLVKALAPAKADFLVVSFSSDWLFPTWQSKRIMQALVRNRRPVSFCEVNSSYGHDAFLLEVEVLGPMIRDFLAQQQEVINAQA